MRQNIGTRSPPSRPEWWLFYSSDRRHGHLCLGQTAAVAARKARRRFGVHWSELELEYLGENPVVEPTWTVDEDDLYTYRVRRAREQFLREATEAQLRRHHLLERLRRADGDLRASRERMFLMHQLQVLADNTERIGNEFRRCREALRPFAKIGLANSRQRPAQQHFVHASRVLQELGW